MLKCSKKSVRKFYLFNPINRCEKIVPSYIGGRNYFTNIITEMVNYKTGLLSNLTFNGVSTPGCKITSEMLLLYPRATTLIFFTQAGTENRYLPLISVLTTQCSGAGKILVDATAGVAI
jgi:hypothetical protein